MKLAGAELFTPESLDQTRMGLTLLDVLSLMKSQKGNFSNIAEAIQFDPASTKKLFSKVNSPYFGLDSPVKDMQHAVSILGVRQLRELLINSTSTSFYHQFVKLEPQLLEIKKHSIAVGCYSKQLAKQLRQYYVKEFYQAGLFHDVGKYVFLFSLGTDYMKIIQEAVSMNYTLHLHERDVLGYDHTEAGLYAAEAWGLPENIWPAVRYHHELTDETKESLTTRQLWIVECVSFANLMSQAHSSISGKNSFYRTYLSDMPPPPGDLSTQDLRLIAERSSTEYLEIIRASGLL